MRNSNPDLKLELTSNAGRYHFYQALRLLYKLRSDSDSAKEARIAFKKAPTKSFPVGEIEKIEFDEDTCTVFTHVIGLFGASGLLPHADRELLDGRDASPLLRDFLDVFNGRIIELLYEAWKKSRPSTDFEFYRKDIPASLMGVKREDACTMMSLSLSGISDELGKQSNPNSRDVFVPATGLLCRRIVTATGIERFLAKQFEFPISVREFCKSKLYLGTKSLTRLSGRNELNNQLGAGAMLGGSVENYGQRFEITIGPLGKSDFQSMCPFGERRVFARFVQIVRSILSHPLDFDIRLLAKPEACTQARLAPRDDKTDVGEPKGTRLGFDSWLSSEPVEEPKSDSFKRFYWDKI